MYKAACVGYREVGAISSSRMERWDGRGKRGNGDRQYKGWYQAARTVHEFRSQLSEKDGLFQVVLLTELTSLIEFL